VPRVTRQAVLDRLAGQHLALALHGAGASICAEQLLQLGELRLAAVQAAVEQEEEVYQRGRAAKSVGLTTCNGRLTSCRACQPGYHSLDAVLRE